jgi:hypothetical protein
MMLREPGGCGSHPGENMARGLGCGVGIWLTVTMSHDTRESRFLMKRMGFVSVRKASEQKQDQDGEE